MNREPIKRPKQVFQLVRNLLGRADREYFVVIPLDSWRRPLGLHVAHVGTLNECEVHPREVFKVAMLVNAASVVLAHNHTSGTAKPSTGDVAATERLSEAGNLLGIPVVEHIIVHGKSYVSLRQLFGNGHDL
ncbi:MAG: JAB domain-containing protein [candidate division KSB1 bacterium]|nr:JAB domain-containing protein [candidate division KSB1 bacterium]